MPPKRREPETPDQPDTITVPRHTFQQTVSVLAGLPFSHPIPMDGGATGYLVLHLLSLDPAPPGPEQRGTP